jgi:hypothetical protein
MHAYIHARMHTYRQTHTHAYIHMYIDASLHSCGATCTPHIATHARTHATYQHAHACMHAYIHTGHAHAYTCMHARMLSSAYIGMAYMPSTCIHTYACLHAQSASMHMHAIDPCGRITQACIYTSTHAHIACADAWIACASIHAHACMHGCMGIRIHRHAHACFHSIHRQENGDSLLPQTRLALSLSPSIDPSVLCTSNLRRSSLPPRPPLRPVSSGSGIGAYTPLQTVSLLRFPPHTAAPAATPRITPTEGINFLAAIAILMIGCPVPCLGIRNRLFPADG